MDQENSTLHKQLFSKPNKGIKHTDLTSVAASGCHMMAWEVVDVLALKDWQAKMKVVFMHAALLFKQLCGVTTAHKATIVAEAAAALKAQKAVEKAAAKAALEAATLATKAAKKAVLAATRDKCKAAKAEAKWVWDANKAVQGAKKAAEDARKAAVREERVQKAAAKVAKPACQSKRKQAIVESDSNNNDTPQAGVDKDLPAAASTLVVAKPQLKLQPVCKAKVQKTQAEVDVSRATDNIHML
jgi:hypothetical protein